MVLKHPIEGEYGEFVIRMMELSDIPAILQHLKENFHRDEPLTSLCPPDDTYPDFVNARIANILKKQSNLCFIAVSKDTDEIAGCQFQFKWTKEEAETGNAPHGTYGLHDEDIPPTRRIINKVMANFDQPKIDLFRRFGVDFLAWNFIASTTQKYRGKGLSSEMYRRMVILMRLENFSVAFSLFTSPFSRRCAEKVGFVETARVNMMSVTHENGKQLLPNSGKDDFISLMALQL